MSFTATLPVRGALLCCAVLLSHAASAAEVTADGDADTSADARVTELDTVTVKGSRNAEPRYSADRSTTATKTDTPLIETPQAVTVVTRELMDATQAQTLKEALNYVPGVFSGVGGRRLFDEFAIRGFRDSGGSYVDGLLDSADQSKYQEAFGLESVEVLKGPASVLYGQLAPGGVVNTVSKRPKPVAFGEIELGVGTDNYYRPTVDIGGPLTTNRNLQYRFAASYLDRDDPQDYAFARSTYVAPSLTWHITDRASLTLLTSLVVLNQRRVAEFPAEGTIEPNPNGPLPIDRYLRRPDENYDRFRSQAAGYAFDWSIDDTWTLRQNFRYSGYGDHYSTSGCALRRDDDGVPVDYRTADCFAYVGTQHEYFIAVDNQAQARFVTGPVEHTALAGVDYQRTRYTYQELSVPAGTLDYYDPQYRGGLMLDGVPPDGANTFLQQTGVYAQDQLKIAKRLIVLLGGRYDTFKDSNVAIDYPDGDYSQSDDHLSGRIGLLYLLPGGFAPYASYSQSFKPSIGRSRTGQQFKPTEGDQYEAGLKFETPDHHVTATLSAFDIRLENVTTTDPVDDNFSIQTGEERHRGIEFETGLHLGNWNAIAGYSLLDAKITKDNSGLVGQRVTNAPVRSGSLYVSYDFDGALRNLVVGAGVRANSDTVGYSGNIHVPGYAVVDLSAKYRWQHWRVGLTANNALDRDYYGNGFGRDRIQLGDAFRVIGTVGYGW